MDNGQIVLFQTQGGETKIEVRLVNESVWLTADQMAELFNGRSTRIRLDPMLKRLAGGLGWMSLFFTAFMPAFG